MSDSPRAPHRLNALLLLHATLIVGFIVRVGRDLASRERIVSTDFAAFDTGWSLILGGHAARLYDAGAQTAMQQRLMAPYVFPGGLMAFLNPPHAALAFTPFAAVDLVTGFRLWTALQLMLLIVLVRDVAAMVRPRGRLGTWVVLTAVAAFPPLWYCVQVGQLSVLLGLALLRLYTAIEHASDARAGFWLFVLSIKPQLLPLLVVLLVCHRRWRVLGWATLLGVVAVALSSAGLGWRIWPSYISNLAHLESYFAQGTVEHMVSLRGLLARALGTAGTGYAAGTVPLAITWAALAFTAVALGLTWRTAHAGQRRARRAEPTESIQETDPTDPMLARRFSLAAGLALALCPHLFLQDVTLWIVPLAVFHRSLAGQPPRVQAFACFALAWPLAFVGVTAYAGATGRSPVVLAFIPITIALVWMARAHAPGRLGVT